MIRPKTTRPCTPPDSGTHAPRAKAKTKTNQAARAASEHPFPQSCCNFFHCDLACLSPFTLKLALSQAHTHKLRLQCVHARDPLLPLTLIYSLSPFLSFSSISREGSKSKCDRVFHDHRSNVQMSRGSVGRWLASQLRMSCYNFRINIP